jgi:hypothetical protein
MTSPPDTPDSRQHAPGRGEPLRSELLREVNQRIREVGREGDAPVLVSLEFVCECGGGGCEEMVPLSAHDYDGIRLGSGLILAMGHAPA